MLLFGACHRIIWLPWGCRLAARSFLMVSFRAALVLAPPLILTAFCFRQDRRALAANTFPGKIMAENGFYTSNLKMNAKFSSSDPVPDGDLEKKFWQKAEWTEFDHDMSGQKHFPQALTRIAARWSTASVYFAFWCRYTTLNIYQGEDPSKERWELWNRDVVEVFLNPEPERVNHYYEFEVAPNNQWIDLEIDKTKTPFNDARWDSHFQHATRVDAQTHVWTCEMRIPVSSMRVKSIAPNARWRLNLFRADGPGDDTQRRFMSWSTISEGTTFHVPARFGLIEFVK
jgi:hypothetical protein